MAALFPKCSDAFLFLTIVVADTVVTLVLNDKYSAVFSFGHEVRIELVSSSQQPKHPC